MVGLLLSAIALAADCSLQPLLEHAENAILSLDLEGGEATLDEARNMFDCGSVTREELATYWLLSAALAEFRDLPYKAEDSLIAARLTAPGLYLESLGPDLKERWQNVQLPDSYATVEFVDLPEGYTVTIDGHPLEGDQVRTGYHVVQIRGGDRSWGRVIRASDGDILQISTGLPPLDVGEGKDDTDEPPIERPSEHVPLQPVPRPPPRRTLGLHAAVGFAGALGTPYHLEPATKTSVQLELGLLVHPSEALWLRGALFGDALLGGSWSYYVPGEQPASLPAGFGALGAAGLHLGDTLDVGLLAGVQLPGRVPVRLLGGARVAPWMTVEGRFGLNIGTPDADGLRLEPAASFHAILQL